jgi:(1->4)-alpha-D-glucan 1-alpha-D-glucosylmutase
LRRRHPEVVLDGAYVPLQPEGPAADHLVAFARHHASGTLVAVVPRLVASLTADARPLPIGEATWTSTRILVPHMLQVKHYRHLFTGETIQPTREPDRSVVAAADVFRTSPVALLWAPRSDA